MSICEIDVASDHGPTTEGEPVNAVFDWSTVKPGLPDIAPAGWNRAETDLDIGSARLAALKPFALSILGRPYQVWDLKTGSPVERSGWIGLRQHARSLARKLGCGADFLYDRLRHICEVGPENVLVSSMLKSGTTGGKGGLRLRGNSSDILWAAIEQVCVDTGRRPGSAKSLEEIRMALLAKGWAGKLPTNTVLRKYSHSDRITSARENAYIRDHLNRVIGKPAESFGLMTVVQLDTTTFTGKDFKLLVVDELGRSMGPANVIFGVLGANRGVWTCLPFVGPVNSYLSGLSIKRGLLAKDQLLNEYGIAGVWPYSGKVGEIRHDNGTEFVSAHLNRVIQDRDIGINESSPAETPHFRGKGERFNRTAHKLFDEFLESDFGRRYVRPVQGHKDAKGIRFSDLERALLEWIVTIYHKRAHQGLGGDSPDSRFEKLVEGRNGLPASGLVPPLLPTPKLHWDFLREDARVINHLGLTWENRVYRHKDLSRLFVVNTRSSKRRVPFRYNPYALKSVFIMIPNATGGEDIIEIPWVPETEKYPMDEDLHRKCMNPSAWEWDLLRADLVRAGNAKPSSGLIESLHAQRKAEADKDRIAGAPKTQVKITDRRNSAMSDSFGEKDLPPVSTPEMTSVAKLSSAKPRYQPVRLRTADGYDAY